MNQKHNKAATIISLRAKIMELRNQLEGLQKVETEVSPAKSRKRLSTEPSNKLNLSRTKRITNPESYAGMRERSKSKGYIPTRHSTYLENSLQIKKNKFGDKNKNSTVKLNLDGLFEDKKTIPNWRYETMFLPKNISRSPSLNRSISNSSIPKNSPGKLRVEVEQLQTPRFQRTTSIRTFKIPSTNPILDPPEQKIPTRKTFAQKNHSPSNIYLNHSGSNPNMFFNSHSQIFLSTNKSNKKNISQMIAETLAPDSIKPNHRERREEKKHFIKHRNFNDTAGSLIYHY